VSGSVWLVELQTAGVSDGRPRTQTAIDRVVDFSINGASFMVKGRKNLP